MSVIVTNAKNRISYAIVKSLGEKGIPVIAADFVPLSMSFASRYSKGFFIYPSPFRDPIGFIDSIIDHLRQSKADVLMPVFEETFLIAKHRDRLLRHVNIVVPTYEQILTAHNKDVWARLAGELGIPVPRSFSAIDLRKSGLSLDEITFPVLIKPKQGGGAWGIVQANSKDELRSLLEEDTCNGFAWERFIVQQTIAGQSLCIAMLFNRGALRGHVVYRQLRDFPVSGGQATLRVSVRNDEIVDHFTRLLQHLQWHGICQADFLVEDGSGTPYLIDINPRFWGSLMQGIASGVDFPYLVYKIALDGDVETVPDYRSGVMTRWIWGDLRAFPGSFRSAADRIGFLKEFLRLFGEPVLYDDFSLKDPLPFFLFGFDYFFKMLRQRKIQPIAHDSLESVWE